MSENESPSAEYENTTDDTLENLKEPDPDATYNKADYQLDEDESQHYACEARWLAIVPEDLAELGGFSTQFAHQVLNWIVPFPRELATSLEFVEGDFHKAVVKLSELDELHLYNTNADLRRASDIWPARGKSAGGFIGTHRRAVLEAQKISNAPIIESNKDNDERAEPALRQMHEL